MRFSRLAWGIIAGAVGIVAGVVVQTWATRFLGTPTRLAFWLSFFGAGGGVLWLADRVGLLESPYAEPMLGLGQHNASDGVTNGHAAPDWRLHFDRGMAAGRAGDVAGALPHFREAVRVAPLQPYPHYELGYTLALLGQWEPALAEFRRTNQLAEGFFVVQTEISIAEAVLSGGLDEESVAMVRRIQQLTDAGHAKSPEAVSASRELIDRQPVCALGYYYLGKALLAADPKASEAALQRCLTLNPDDTTVIDALTHIGILKHEAGDTGAAQEIWSNVVTKYKNNPHVKPTKAFFAQANSRVRKEQ